MSSKATRRRGVQRQWCGRRGKKENCVVGQHLLYCDNYPDNPFTCVVAGDLFLPEHWANVRKRCREAGIPEEVVYRPKWQVAFGRRQVEKWFARAKQEAGFGAFEVRTYTTAPGLDSTSADRLRRAALRGHFAKPILRSPIGL